MNARGRIDGIDFWRGFALLTIFINHVPDNILSNVTHKNFGFSDAAEAFVFLSGMSVALAYGSYFFRGETGGGIRAVLRRAFKLYWVQILLSFLVIMLFAAAAFLMDEDELTDDEDRQLVVAHPARGILGILAMGHQLDFINILPLYVVLLLATPAFLWLARRNGWLMLAASAALYAVARIFDLNLPTWPLEGTWFFNPFAWQLLFVSGLFIGSRIRNEDIPYDRRVFVVCVAMLVVSLVLMTKGFGYAPVLWDNFGQALDHSKTDLGLVRLAHFFALAYVVYYSGLTRLMPAIFVFKPVALMGRFSLPVFATGCVLAAISQVIDETSEDGLIENLALSLVIVACGVLIHYLVARYLAARADLQKGKAAVVHAPSIAPVGPIEAPKEQQPESLQVS